MSKLRTETAKCAQFEVLDGCRVIAGGRWVFWSRSIEVWCCLLRWPWALPSSSDPRFRTWVRPAAMVGKKMGFEMRRKWMRCGLSGFGNAPLGRTLACCLKGYKALKEAEQVQRRRIRAGPQSTGYHEAESTSLKCRSGTVVWGYELVWAGRGAAIAQCSQWPPQANAQEAE